MHSPHPMDRLAKVKLIGKAIALVLVSITVAVLIYWN